MKKCLLSLGLIFFANNCFASLIFITPTDGDKVQGITQLEVKLSPNYKDRTIKTVFGHISKKGLIKQSFVIKRDKNGLFLYLLDTKKFKNGIYQIKINTIDNKAKIHYASVFIKIKN